MVTFEALAHHHSKKAGRELPSCLLCIDPGETTGWAIFHTTGLFHVDQFGTPDAASGTEEVKKILLQYKPDEVVIEDYRVYSWRSQHHSWSSLHTPRLIGGIEYLCHERGIKLTKQMAQTGKNFVSNEKLKAWGFYRPGKKHAMDAVRHGCYYLVFGPPKFKLKPKGHHVG